MRHPFRNCTSSFPSKDKKKVYCCQEHHLGCEHEDDVQPPVHDCVSGYSSWRHSWSDTRKLYCCHKYGLACEEEETHHVTSIPSTADPFDCTAGFKNWRHGWSAHKKGFCCHKYGLGCQHKTHPFSEPFDCSAGFDNWHRGWSRHKKAYCCQRYQLGCVQSYGGGSGLDAFDNVHHLYGKPGHFSVVSHQHHQVHYHTVAK